MKNPHFEGIKKKPSEDRFDLYIVYHKMTFIATEKFPEENPINIFIAFRDNISYNLERSSERKRQLPNDTKVLYLQKTGIRGKSTQCWHCLK